MPTLTQSVAAVAGAAMNKYATGSAPIDSLLDGGFKCGSILEISGPPGVAVHGPVINIAREFVKEGQGVIFAGLSPRTHAAGMILMRALDMHNSMTAAQLLEHMHTDGEWYNTSNRSLVHLRFR